MEIEAKIAAGYFTTGHIPDEKELQEVQGRQWDDIPH